jgi:hypothetical protein
MNQQASENAMNNALSGSQMTSSTPPITQYNLRGY